METHVEDRAAGDPSRRRPRLLPEQFVRQILGRSVDLQQDLMLLG